MTEGTFFWPPLPPWIPKLHESMEFCSGGEKMRNASGHWDENERQWKKKSEKEHVRHFLHKTNNQEVSRSLTLKSCKTMAKKCTKKVCCSCKVAFLLIRPIVVFFHCSRYVYIPSQDSDQDFEPGLVAKLDNFFFSPSPLRGGFSWQSWKESSS